MIDKSSLKIFFRAHTEGFLIAIAIVLIGIIASCFVWGVVFVATNLDQVSEFKSGPAQNIEFNLSGAAALDLHVPSSTQ